MKITTSLYFILFTCFASFAQEVNEWENPLVYERNKLEPHTDFIAYTNETDARADVFSTSLSSHVSGISKLRRYVPTGL